MLFSRRIPTSKVTVLGYGLFTSDAQTLIDTLHRQNFKVVIVDESHYMKSRNATRSKILLPIVQNAVRAILLTGTPALGRPEEVLDIIFVWSGLDVTVQMFCALVMHVYAFHCIFGSWPWFMISVDYCDVQIWFSNYGFCNYSLIQIPQQTGYYKPRSEGGSWHVQIPETYS